MKKRARLLAALAILLVAGLGIGLYLLVTDDDDDDAGDDDDIALGTSTTLDDGTPLLTTSTTTGEGAGTSTTTTTPGATTTTTSATTTTTAAGGTTTTSTTRPPTGVCGTGTARVTITARDLTTTPTESAFIPEAQVENSINRPIEVESLSADVTFPDGSSRRVTFSTTGVVIASNTTATFTSERIVSPAQYTAARVAAFVYFTSGQRERCRVSL
jgi:hypothetical protein